MDKKQTKDLEEDLKKYKHVSFMKGVIKEMRKEFKPKMDEGQFEKLRTLLSFFEEKKGAIINLEKFRKLSLPGINCFEIKNDKIRLPGVWEGETFVVFDVFKKRDKVFLKLIGKE